MREAKLVVQWGWQSVLDSKAQVESREYRDGNVPLTVQAPESVLRHVARYVKE